LLSIYFAQLAVSKSCSFAALTNVSIISALNLSFSSFPFADLAASALANALATCIFVLLVSSFVLFQVLLCYYNKNKTMKIYPQTNFVIEDHRCAIFAKTLLILTSLRTAVANEYTLNKEATIYDDCLDDALRLSLKPYEFAQYERIL
jgi:hypothetical protein